MFRNFYERLKEEENSIIVLCAVFKIGFYLFAAAWEFPSYYWKWLIFWKQYTATKIQQYFFHLRVRLLVVKYYSLIYERKMPCRSLGRARVPEAREEYCHWKARRRINNLKNVRHLINNLKNVRHLINNLKNVRHLISNLKIVRHLMSYLKIVRHLINKLKNVRHLINNLKNVRHLISNLKNVRHLISNLKSAMLLINNLKNVIHLINNLKTWSSDK